MITNNHTTFHCLLLPMHAQLTLHSYEHKMVMCWLAVPFTPRCSGHSPIPCLVSGVKPWSTEVRNVLLLQANCKVMYFILFAPSVHHTVYDINVLQSCPQIPTEWHCGFYRCRLGGLVHCLCEELVTEWFQQSLYWEYALSSWTLHTVKLYNFNYLNPWSNLFEQINRSINFSNQWYYVIS